MPCDTIRINQSVASARDAELRIQELERQLIEKSARIVKQGNKVRIEGWNNRGGWCDACSLRKLRQSKDARVRQMANAALSDSATLNFNCGH